MGHYANVTGGQTKYDFSDGLYENEESLREKRLKKYSGHCDERLELDKFTHNSKQRGCYFCLGFLVGCVLASSVCVAVYFFLLPYLKSLKGRLYFVHIILSFHQRKE